MSTCPACGEEGSTRHPYPSRPGYHNCTNLSCGVVVFEKGSGASNGSADCSTKSTEAVGRAGSNPGSPSQSGGKDDSDL